MDNTPLPSGDKTPYKQIDGCYTDEDNDTSSSASSDFSSGEEEIREVVPRPDPATWFNSKQRNTKAINDIQQVTESSRLNTAINNKSELTIRKRPATPFNISSIPEEAIPDKKKTQLKSTNTKKVKKQLTLTNDRCGELASVRISVPPGVEVITINVVKRGLSRYTTHALAEDRVDVIPLAASRDLNKFNGIKPSEGIIQKSLSVSN